MISDFCNVDKINYNFSNCFACIYIVELKEIDDVDLKGIYWQVKFPFMMSNRDVSLYKILIIYMYT